MDSPLSPSAPFKLGVPRLTSVGGPDSSRDSGTTFDDEWTLVLPAGQRPGVNLPGMPKVGDELAGAVVGASRTARFVVSKVSWRKNAPTSLVWVATVTYVPGIRTASTSGGGTATDFDFRWGSRSVQADFTQDAVDGRPVLNSAGEPFENVPQREMLLPCLSFRRVTSAAPAQYSALNGTVNADPVTVMGVTFGKHCARLRFEARRIDEGEEGAGRYEYTFQIEGAKNMYAFTVAPSGDPDEGDSDETELEDIGWDISILDCGYSCLEPVDGGDYVLRPIYIEDADGNRVRPTSPQLLHGGAADATQAYFLKFSPYPEASWGPLNLPA